MAFSDRLKHIFIYSMVNNLVWLQHLEVCQCWSMGGVAETISTKSPKKKKNEGRLIEMDFLRLHYLRLIDLPKLMGFAMGIHYVNSPLEF